MSDPIEGEVRDNDYHAVAAKRLADVRASDDKFYKRICVLDVARGYTVDCTHPLIVGGVAEAQPVQEYPHDIEEVLKQLDPEIEVHTVYLKPNKEEAIERVSKLKETYSVFINLYDLSDSTGQGLVDYMEENNIAFTGAGSRFYDPTRAELKRICRLANLNTPLHMMCSDPNDADRVLEELGGFPLFIKPEHGYDSECFFVWILLVSMSLVSFVYRRMCFRE